MDPLISDIVCGLREMTPASRSRRGPRDYPPIALSTGQCSRSRFAIAEGAPSSPQLGLVMDIHDDAQGQGEG